MWNRSFSEKTTEGGREIDDYVNQNGWHLNPKELVNQGRLHMKLKISDDNIFRYRQIPFSSLKFTFISTTIMGLVTLEKYQQTAVASSIDTAEPYSPNLLYW